MNLSPTISKIDAAFVLLNETKAELLSHARVIDDELSDHYHTLELVAMDASQTAKITDGMRAILKDRRAVKEHLSIIESILDGYKTIQVRSAKRVAGYEDQSKESFHRIMGQWK